MRSRSTLAALALACVCAGCGSSATGGGDSAITLTDTASRTPVARDCAGASLEALERVGHSLYEESATGRIVAQASFRLASSQALAATVARGDAAAAKRVLRSLLLNQIVSVRVQRAGRTLARIERGAGIAPAQGRLKLSGQTVGTFTVAVQGANGYAQTASGLTATQVVVRGGGQVLASTLHPAPSGLRSNRHEVSIGGMVYRVDTFVGRGFPNRPLTISLLVPKSSLTADCARWGSSVGPQQAQANAWGRVAERVYDAEHLGGKAQRILNLVERSRAFRTAALAGNAAAARAAIIGFFRAHLHVVRVRVERAGLVLVDVGGPYVLAPIPGVIRGPHGRVVAHFELAIQDDLGFTILARAFTGAQTIMRVGQRQVMGTLRPGPARIPDRGLVSYRGVTYRAYSFYGEAFPSGSLRISLLYPAS
jgi:hypothetical protein